MTGDLWHDFFVVLGGIVLFVGLIVGIVFAIVRYRWKIASGMKSILGISGLSRLPVILWISAIVYAFFKFESLAAGERAVVHIAAATAAIILILFNVQIVRMKDGVRVAAVVEFLGFPVRSGSGAMFVFNPLWFIPVEKITTTEVLGENLIDDKIVTETADEEVVPIDYAGEYRVTDSGLINAKKFGARLKDMINQRLRSLLSGEVRKRAKDEATGKTGRDRVHDEKDLIAKAVEKEFMEKHADRYGVTLVLHIDDPELPPKLAEKEIEREVQKKENERREMEMTKLDELAENEVKKADARGEKLTFKEAQKNVQVALKIVPENREIKGLDEGTQELIRDGLKLVKEILPAFSKKRECPCAHREPPKDKIGFPGKQQEEK